MNQDKPLISIIIPAYNAADYIHETLVSALSQTWPNKEIIIVNDGSNDDTEQVLAPYREVIHYVYQENRGLSGARNTGIRQAKGDFFAFLDADDLWLPDFLERQITFLLNHSEVDIVYSWWSYIDKSGQDLPEKGQFAKRGRLLPLLVTSNRFPIHTALLRKCCIESSGGFDENRNICEDWDFWLRLALKGHQFDYLPLVLAKYRFHGSNMTLNVTYSHMRYLNALDKLFSGPHPKAIKNLKGKAYGQIYLSTAVLYFTQDNLLDAENILRDGLKTYPDLLFQRDTYYRLICAEQSPGYRNTELFMDLERAHERVNHLFETLLTDDSLQISQKAMHKAIAIQSIVFAGFYYDCGDNIQARRYLIKAIRTYPPTIFMIRSVELGLRTLIGKYRVQKIKTLVCLPIRSLSAKEKNGNSITS